MDKIDKPQPAAVAPVPRKKKSSFQGDVLFITCLVAYGATMVASFQGKVPVQKWEIQTLQESIQWAKLMEQHLWLPVVLSVLYVIFCFTGRAYFSTRKGYDKELRLPLAAWSLFLAVFSWIGSIRTVPMLYEILRTGGVVHLICGDTRYEWLVENPAGFWTFVFCLSKIPELLDTFFIVFRKKELITLHWYHHFTVMLFCWHSWATCTLTGLIFAAMNLSVHTVMYSFYFFTAMGYRPTRFALFITLGQIIQMVVGTAVTMYIVLDKTVWHPVQEFDFSLHIPDWFTSEKPRVQEDGPCHVSSGNALCGLIMYGSYLGFFVHFFYKAYCARGAKGE